MFSTNIWSSFSKPRTIACRIRPTVLAQPIPARSTCACAGRSRGPRRPLAHLPQPLPTGGFLRHVWQDLQPLQRLGELAGCPVLATQSCIRIAGGNVCVVVAQLSAEIVVVLVIAVLAIEALAPCSGLDIGTQTVSSIDRSMNQRYSGL